MIKYHFQVKTDFKQDGKPYKHGETWEPTGNREKDDPIITSNYFVMLVPDEPDPEKQAKAKK